MKTIDKNELFGHVRDFLKTKGIELQEGSYTRRINKGCNLLADTINLSQEAVKRAKTGMDKGLDKMRQVIHEQTAPRASAAAPPAPTPFTPPQPEPKKARARKAAPAPSPSAPPKRPRRK